MISVIVPVYKVEPYLRGCLDSIGQQTFEEYEVILVDDGSPDHCGKICDEYAAGKENWTVLHQKNAGLSGARNAGLLAAKGEYVCFIDGDDTVDKNYLYLLHKAITDHCADLAICGYQRLKNANEIKETYDAIETFLNKDALWQEVFGRLNNAAWNKLYKKELLTGQKFPEGLYHGEDLMFNLEYITKCERAVMTTAPLYHYWERSGSITKSGFSERKLMEIVSKDLAKEFVSTHYPALIQTAEKYCFRARMNVVRAIYKAKLQKQYQQAEKECTNYVKKNYHGIRKRLNVKERVEYNLFANFRWLYCFLTK